MTIVAIIPARGGSKGIPGKNIRSLLGKPLLAYTIEHARNTPSIDHVVVSTDSEQIAVVAEEYGAEVIMRPSEISGDEATSESALLHVLDYLKQTDGYEPDLVVFLQCTSPIRKRDDISRALERFYAEEADSLLSVVPTHAWLWRIENGHPHSYNFDYRNRPRRQERPAEYNENGSIYIFKPWVLRRFNNRLGGKIALYEMDPVTNIDIDTPQDLILAECLLQQQSKQ